MTARGLRPSSRRLAALAASLVAIGVVALGASSTGGDAGGRFSSALPAVAPGSAPTVRFATSLGHGGTSTSPRSPVVLRQTGAVFDDTIGDAASGPDLARIAITDDAAGNIAFGVVYANRTCASAGDLVFVDLDVDGDPSTGSPDGIDYLLFLDVPGNRRGVARWDGTLFQPIAVVSLRAGCDAQGFDYWIVNRAALGIAASFDFYASACADANRTQCPDTAPDAPPPWRYQLSTTPPPPRPPPPPPPPPPVERTVDDAPDLPKRPRYASTSIRHGTLATRIYATMKAVGGERRLQVACWSTDDWRSVLADLRVPRERARRILGFWLAAQRRFLHLAPSVCGDLQALLNSKRGNARRAFASTIALHEAAHMYGVRNEAEASCYGVQLVYFFARRVGVTHAASLEMERLAVRTTRQRAPRGYWNATRCRDGGAWDLDDENRNLDY